jgi:hypothetical protein
MMMEVAAHLNSAEKLVTDAIKNRVEFGLSAVHFTTSEQ